MRLRPRSLYDVLALISFFLVVGGGTALASFVISANSQVGPGTISGHHPPGGKHANLISRSVAGQDMQNNALTGAQIKESTLSAVPNALRLGGLGPSAFLASSAVRRFGPVPVVRPGSSLPSVTLIHAGRPSFQPRARVTGPRSSTCPPRSRTPPRCTRRRSTSGRCPSRTPLSR
jgi:hypothetical protein